MLYNSMWIKISQKHYDYLHIFRKVYSTFSDLRLLDLIVYQGFIPNPLLFLNKLINNLT